MSLRTVRLRPEAEEALKRIVRATGLSISGALNHELLALNENLGRRGALTP